MRVSWHFYGTTWNDPTVGDFLEFLRELGVSLVASVPAFRTDRGHASVDMSAPLVGKGLYLTDTSRTDGGALSLATEPIDRQHRQLWQSVRNGDAPEARDLSTVAALTAYDAPDSQHYSSLTKPVLVALGELFPPGFGLQPDQRRLVSTQHLRDELTPLDRADDKEVEEPLMTIDTYGLWGRYLIGRDQRDNVHALIHGTPVLSRIASLVGDSLTVDGRGVALTRDEWGHLQTAIVTCAGRAKGGFVEVRCRDRFDTRFPARG